MIEVPNENNNDTKDMIKNPPLSSSSATNTNGADEIIDVANMLSLKPGTRIEVKWDLSFDNDAPTGDTIHKDEGTGNGPGNGPGNGHDNGTTVASSAEASNKSSQDTTALLTSESRWWGGTLLSEDKRTYTIDNGDDDKAIVPLRSIDYDPYLPSFPDRSIEDVCFLSNHSLFNISSESRTCWRLEGDGWEPSSNTHDEIMDQSNRIDTESNENECDDEISVASASQEDGLREVLDTILKSALEKSGVMEKMNNMERSTQSIMAAKIATTKERLVEKFMEKLNDDEDHGLDKVVTPELVSSVMAELGKELRS
jgi:hypothetical protein